MILKMLVENTAISSQFKKKHGLSIYVESLNNKLIFDLGSNNLFSKHAEKLNVDIQDINHVIISHGHLDHGGGLSDLLKLNQKANVYIHTLAFEPYYTKLLSRFKYYIGLDRSLKTSKQIIFTTKSHIINDHLQLFSDVNYTRGSSTVNDSLYTKNMNGFEVDDFSHEQNLIIKEDNKYILIAGCAHAGILNVIQKGEDICGQEFDYVISGMHLYNPISKKGEDVDTIKNLGQQLLTKKTTYYTCHCTGKKAYNQLKEIMGDKINYLSTGATLEL